MKGDIHAPGVTMIGCRLKAEGCGHGVVQCDLKIRLARLLDPAVKGRQVRGWIKDYSTLRLRI
jgi:hypothetical protein